MNSKKRAPDIRTAPEIPGQSWRASSLEEVGTRREGNASLATRPSIREAPQATRGVETFLGAPIEIKFVRLLVVHAEGEITLTIQVV